MPAVVVAVTPVAQSGGATAPELPTDDLVARWHIGAGITEGVDTAPDPDEATVVTWTDVEVSGAAPTNATPAEQPRLVSGVPTFEGDGSSVVHCLKTNASPIADHKTHTLAFAVRWNSSPGRTQRVFESNHANKLIRVLANNDLIGFYAQGASEVLSAVSVDGTFRVLTLTLDAVTGDVVMYDGETPIASSSSYDGSADLSSLLGVGSNAYGAMVWGFNGKIYEIDAYSSVLDAAKRAQLAAFLESQYS